RRIAPGLGKVPPGSGSRPGGLARQRVRALARKPGVTVLVVAKRTMEAAQALYGVTMQEPGVSRLVSVKFHGEAAAAPAAWRGSVFGRHRPVHDYRLRLY
ncbi:MAG TPA: hypothetical protein VGH38_14860, partial [Bryobacteraceae bacterium]